MLTDDFPKPDLFTALVSNVVAEVSGNRLRGGTIRIATGVYERGSFGCTNYVPGWDEWPDFRDGEPPSWRGPTGVCDTVDQVLQHYPELEADPERTFVVFLTRVRKADQEPDGGWRWHL